MIRDVMQVRDARASDIDAVVDMTRAQRHLLARWSPVYFRPGVDADERHAQYLAFIVSSPAHDVRVVVDEHGDVVGARVVNPQRIQWFFDDVCVRDERQWPDAGAALIDSVVQRPCVTCVSPHDARRQVTSEDRGYVHVSSYFSRSVEPTGNEHRPNTERSRALHTIEPNPPHTFGGSIDPSSAGALVIDVADVGYVVSSPSITPPVYDPGGPSCVIDRIHGRERGRLLDLAVTAAAQRGDRQVIAVVASADAELLGVLDARGFEQQILVYCRHA